MKDKKVGSRFFHRGEILKVVRWYSGVNKSSCVGCHLDGNGCEDFVCSDRSFRLSSLNKLMFWK